MRKIINVAEYAQILIIPALMGYVLYPLFNFNFLIMFLSLVVIIVTTVFLIKLQNRQIKSIKKEFEEIKNEHGEIYAAEVLTTKAYRRRFDRRHYPFLLTAWLLCIILIFSFTHGTKDKEDNKRRTNAIIEIFDAINDPDIKKYRPMIITTQHTGRLLPNNVENMMLLTLESHVNLFSLIYDCEMAVSEYEERSGSIDSIENEVFLRNDLQEIKNKDRTISDMYTKINKYVMAIELIMMTIGIRLAVNLYSEILLLLDYNDRKRNFKKLCFNQEHAE